MRSVILVQGSKILVPWKIARIKQYLRRTKTILELGVAIRISFCLTFCLLSNTFSSCQIKYYTTRKRLLSFFFLANKLPT